MVAKLLTKAAQEAKEIWDSYNKKDGKNYNKKFEDNKPPKSKAEKDLTDKQRGKLFKEKRKLKKKDPERYKDLTQSGITRKRLKPETIGDYASSQGKSSYKDGGMPKKKKEGFKDKGFYEYLGEIMNKKPKPKPKPKPKKTKTNNKEGVNIKNGGTLRVLKKGVVSGSYS